MIVALWLIFVRVELQFQNLIFQFNSVQLYTPFYESSSQFQFPIQETLGVTDHRKKFETRKILQATT